MKRSTGRSSDTTGDTAVTDVAGDVLLVEVFSRIEDERDRVLIIAHIGLDISLRNLARVLGATPAELADRVTAIIVKLREDAELTVMLAEIHRAGQSDRYQALALRLGLQDWFCSYCGDFMLQSERGAKRKTCSDKCRYGLFQAHGIGWKNMQQLKLANTAVLKTLFPPILSAKHHSASPLYHEQPDVICRNRALLLLGLMCPIPLSSSDLSELNINDVSRHASGLRVRLYGRSRRGSRYVTVAAGDYPEICPVTAVSTWQTRLTYAGRTSGPLFVRMDTWGNLPTRQTKPKGNLKENNNLVDAFPRFGGRLTDQSVAQIITAASRLRWPGSIVSELRPREYLIDFFNEIAHRV